MVTGYQNPYDPTVRTAITDDQVALWAWPSRGGVIILDHAEAMDFDFLDLDPLHPPPRRHEDQDAEDTFCQRLLLLGAKWWDSEERYLHVSSLQDGRPYLRHLDGSLRDKVSGGQLSRPAPTMREKRWVKVGWPSAGGGLWVSEFDTTWAGVDEEWNLPPHEEGLAKVKLARSMDERCQILRESFRAKFYNDVTQYEGYTFLRAWQWKTTGEAGEKLLSPEETWQEWRDNL